MTEDRVLDAIRCLNSGKKKERFESGFDELGSLLDQDRVIVMLRENSISKAGLDWDTVFIKVHNAIINEIDKCKTTNIVQKQVDSMRSRVQQISNKAFNERKEPLISCNVMVTNILSVFDEEPRVRYMGAVYFDLLVKILKLPQKNYCNRLKEEHWTQLKDMCVQRYKEPLGIGHSGQFLDALFEMVKSVSKHSVSCFMFLDLFKFLEDIYCQWREVPTSNFDRSLIRLTDILCLNLAVEFRKKVCAFMENVFDYVMSKYETGKEKVKFIYHFLMIDINVHQPSGVDESDISAYAHDCDKWKRQLKDIFAFCCKEIDHVRKSGSTQFDSNFINLLVDLTHLVFTTELDVAESSYSNEDVENSYRTPGLLNKRKRSSDYLTQSLSMSVGGPSKRIKLRFDELSNILQDLQHSNALFWLWYLEALLERYPSTIHNDFLLGVESLCKVVSENRDQKSAQKACRCLCILLDLGKDLKFSAEDEKKLAGMWSDMGDTLIRCLHNDTSVDYHKLLRCLMKHNKLRDPSALLELYCGPKLDATLQNFLTLLSLFINVTTCEGTVAEIFGDKQRISVLFDWIFQTGMSHPPEELAKLLVVLVIKRAENEMDLFRLEEDQRNTSANQEHLCASMMNAFSVIYLKNVQFFSDGSESEKSYPDAKIETDLMEKLFVHLNNYVDESLNNAADENLSQAEQINNLFNMLYSSQLILHLSRYLEKLNIQYSEPGLEIQLKELVNTSTTKALGLFKLTPFNLSPFLKLYQKDFGSTLNSTIREKSCTRMDFLKYLFDVFNIFDEEHHSVAANIKQYFDASPLEIREVDATKYSFSRLIECSQIKYNLVNLSAYETIVVQACNILCSFCDSKGDSEVNRFQSVLATRMIRVLSDRFANFNFKTSFHLHLVLGTLYGLRKVSTVTSKILDLMKQIVQLKTIDTEVRLLILQILKELAVVVHGSEDAEIRSKYVQLIELFRNIALKKKCGPKLALDFVTCLGEIGKVDVNGSWAFIYNGGARSRLAGEIIEFLSYPSCEVMLNAAQHVGLVFRPPTDFEKDVINWQQGLMRKMNDALKENRPHSYLKESLVEEHSKDVLASVSLISWAQVISSSYHWRDIALYRLFSMSHVQRLRRTQVESIVKILLQKLGIEDSIGYMSRRLPDLFVKWAEAGYEAQDFPMYLLDCENVSDFYNQFLDVIVLTYWKVDKLECLLKILKTMKFTTEEIVKRCLPSIIAYGLTCKNYNFDKICRFFQFPLAVSSLIELDSVIFHLINNHHDLKYFSEMCGKCMDVCRDSSDKNLAVSEIIRILDTLEIGPDKFSLEKICLKKPKIIQKVLLSLWTEVESSVIYEDKVVSFFNYVIFVSIVSLQVKNGISFSDLNSFFIRDVCYTIVSVIRKDKSVMLKIACKGLKTFCECILEEFSDIFMEFLPMITSALVPPVKDSQEDAKDVLTFLICNQYHILKETILMLDPFPCDGNFQQIQDYKEMNTTNVNLENEIQRFVSVRRNTGSSCSIEGLKHLRETLTNGKREIRSLYEKLENIRGFSEDCQESLLHQLICVLVELTSSKEEAIRMEAARGLGEIGPIDLKTLALKAESGYHSRNRDSPFTRLIATALSIFSELIIDEDLNIKKLACSALHSLLMTKEGNHVYMREVTSKKNLKCVMPFTASEHVKWNLQLKEDRLLNNLSNREIWIPLDHKNWIRRIVKCFLVSLDDKANVINSFTMLSEFSVQFCERIFPILIDLVVTSMDGRYKPAISENFDRFFNQYIEEGANQNWSKTSVQCLIKVVDYIRVQRNFEGIFKPGLDINYLNVARAALHCSAYFTAVLYSDQWYHEKKSLETSQFDIDKLCEKYPEDGSTLTRILRESYSQLGIFDGVHGCGYMHLLDVNTEVEHYEHLGNWSLNMLHNDIKLSQNQNYSARGLCTSLKEAGMIHTVNNVIKSIKSPSELSSIQYECAALLKDWTILNANSDPESYEKNNYLALKACHNEDEIAFHVSLKKARDSVISELLHCNLESCKNLYCPLAKLECLKELEDFVTARKEGPEKMSALCSKWKLQDEIRWCEFKHFEAILSQRSTFVKDALEKTDDTCLSNSLWDTYHKLIKTARKEKKFEVGIRNLQYLASLQDLPSEGSVEMKIEKARIFWEMGEENVGRFYLLHGLNKNEITGEHRVKALRLYGDWLAQTKSENSHSIIENYFIKSIDESNDVKNRAESYASLAKFADVCYMQLKDYLSSPLFDTKRELIFKQQDLATKLRQEMSWNESRDTKLAHMVASKQSAIDQGELRNLKMEMDFLLNLAVKYYLMTLKDGEDYDLLIFRMISLWLSNASNDSTVTGHVQELVDGIPTYKFLSVLPQIVPRMADVNLIASIVEKCCESHPHHTLPLVFSLAKSYDDAKYSKSKPAAETPRIIVAQSMLDKLKGKPHLLQSIVQMNRFCDALIELANTPPKPSEKVSGSVPKNLKISRIENLELVSMPTDTIPYNKSCNYKIVGVRRFEDSYRLVGGVNKPKKIKCTGTDGVDRSLLIKGNDDLRQDAVMQQVFTIVNSLLSQNKETNERKLVMKTYKVVPLSQRSGIIEWCEDTQPLTLYLVGPDGRSGVHKRINPNDITAVECRERIKAMAELRMSNKEKLQSFLDICRKFQPAFHHFFTENFASAVVSFERRLAYIRSVAVSSMIGYILGIGDRHVSNILIDNFSAEVIHIDLGIAFEQGKTLPTPEMVPFRLTRDMVDGMGSCGIEGVFRLSCVKTMEVLHDNQNTLLNVLEVLLYDPLYAWSITPEQAVSLQSEDKSTNSSSDEGSSSDVEINKLAERALLRLKQKLQGTEDGVATNVEAQVNSLIQQARDPGNLSRMFHGWQAYL